MVTGVIKNVIMQEGVVSSEFETKWLGLKFGRYNTECIDADLLKAAVLENSYDVVRVRTVSTDDVACLKLSRAGFPFYFSGGVRRYKVDCFEVPLPPFTDTDVSFELFTGQNRAEMERIITESMIDSPIGYYRSPGLSDRITKEMEAKCLYEYYAHYNNNSIFPGNYLWFMRLANENVGFIALNIYREKDMVDSSLAGFPKKFQGQGLFPNILRHIRGFCREQNIRYFCCGARLENLYSQWAFEKDFMKGVGIDYVFHVVPMLSCKTESSPTTSLR